MLKLFIFSNAYVAKNMIPIIDYLFDDNILEVFVLEENHRQEDFINSDIPVRVCDNVEYCIDNADLTVIVVDEDIPKCSIDNIKAIINRKEKKCLELSNPWKKISPINENLWDTNLINSPSICSIAVGVSSQSFPTEIRINQIFSEKAIPTKQFFSESTLKILTQINHIGMLNAPLRKQLEDKDNVYQVAITSFEVEETDLKQLKNIIELVKHISPDYIVLQTHSFANSNEIKTFIENNLSLKIDMLIKSNFGRYTLDNIYYTTDNKDNIPLVETKSIKTLLEKSILAKISFPKGCILF